MSATVTPDVSNPGSLAWNDLGSAGAAGDGPVTLTFEALQPGATPDTDDTAAVDTVDEFASPVTEHLDTNSDLVITDPSIDVAKTLDHPDAFIPVGGTATYTIP